jgi:hypothetical protein
MGKKKGRPTVYSKKLGDEIAKQLSLGKSLRRICKEEDMPTMSTCLLWAVDLEHPFSEQYDRGRELQAEYFADELQDIADDGSNDFMMTKFGIKVDKEHIQRSRLRVDTRKWIASKLKPKRYGDKIQNEHSGRITLSDLIDESMKPEGEKE